MGTRRAGGWDIYRERDIVRRASRRAGDGRRKEEEKEGAGVVAVRIWSARLKSRAAQLMSSSSHRQFVSTADLPSVFSNS